MRTVFDRLCVALGAILKLAALAMVALFFVASSVGGANAATCGTPVVFTATANVGITCGGYGNGNDINGIGGDEPASPTLAGYVDSGFLADGALSLTGLGATSGTWSITAPLGFGFSSLVIAFQGEVAMTNPDWAWFSLATGALSGTWSIASTNGKTLDRAYIYGQKVAVDPRTGAVPVPGGIVLGATGLGVLGLIGQRRKKKLAA
jgi:hypothetical protein